MLRVQGEEPCKNDCTTYQYIDQTCSKHPSGQDHHVALYVDPRTNRNAVAPIYRPSVLGHITSGAYATRARARSTTAPHPGGGRPAALSRSPAGPSAAGTRSL
eukprot:1618931-Prymnesium_polylepis.1